MFHDAVTGFSTNKVSAYLYAFILSASRKHFYIYNALIQFINL